MRSAARLLLAAAVVALASSAAICPALHPQTQSPTAQTLPATEPVDINMASLDQLMRIPGLPRTWAARIIRFRPYRGKNELLDRGIVSPEVYARIKDHIIAHRVHN